MKKLMVVLAVCTMTAVSFAGLTTDVNYSTDDGGSWHYDGVDSFSFIQPIGIDDVQSSGVDSLVGQFVYIPNFTLSGVSITGGLVEAAIGVICCAELGHFTSTKPSALTSPSGDAAKNP